MLYNCWWLLVGKGRWRNEQMAIFYAFSFLILVSRLIFLFTWKQQEGASDMKLGLFTVTEEIANYSKVCLGICQVLAMCEIAIRLK